MFIDLNDLFVSRKTLKGAKTQGSLASIKDQPDQVFFPRIIKIRLERSISST